MHEGVKYMGSLLRLGGVCVTTTASRAIGAL